MTTQLVQVQSSIVNFFCPVCGERICAPKSGFRKSCDHLLFAWLSETGEWEYLREDVDLDPTKENFDWIPSDSEVLTLLPRNSVVFDLREGAPSGMSMVIGVQIPEE